MVSFIRTEGHELYAIGQVIKVDIKSTDEAGRWEVYFQTGKISSPTEHAIFGGTLEQAQLFLGAFMEAANDGTVVIEPVALRETAFKEPRKQARRLY